MRKWPLETAEQLRAGRAMADMAREELAELAGLSEATVKRLERLKGKLSASTTTIASLEAALESKGITFVPGNGGPPRVRYKPRRY